MKKSETIEKTRQVLRVMHRAKMTENAYVSWISQYMGYLKDNIIHIRQEFKEP